MISDSLGRVWLFPYGCSLSINSLLRGWYPHLNTVKRVSVNVKSWKHYPTLSAILVLLILLCSVTGVIAFLDLMSIVTTPKTTTSPPPRGQLQSPTLTPSHLDTFQVQQGEKLFLEIRDRSPAVLQVRSGRGSRGATAALVIPRPWWSHFSQQDQLSLTFFAESLIPEIRSDPATFANVPATAPTYTQAVKDIANLCDSCWIIIVGEVTSTDRITLEEIVAQGSGA